MNNVRLLYKSSRGLTERPGFFVLFTCLEFYLFVLGQSLLFLYVPLLHWLVVIVTRPHHLCAMNAVGCACGGHGGRRGRHPNLPLRLEGLALCHLEAGLLSRPHLEHDDNDEDDGDDDDADDADDEEGAGDIRAGIFDAAGW